MNHAAYTLEYTEFHNIYFASALLLEERFYIG